MALHFGSADPLRSSEISRAVKAGKMRKLAPKIYTDDLKSPPEDIIRRNRLEIIAHFYPGAVISHRSAIEGNVSPRGKLHLTMPGAVTPVRELPGLEIRVWRGPPAQSDDIRTSFGDQAELFTASQARAMLENMQVARARGEDEAKTLDQEEIERWIDRQIRVFGAGWLDQMRAQSAEVAARLGWTREQSEFAALVDALQGKSTGFRLVTDLARSRAQGQPYDPERVALFATLQARLAAERFVELPRPPAAEFENRAFWEAYFSNFIEGTKFTVEEARTIVFEPSAAKALEHKRPEDAHDVRETYRLIVDPKISAELPKSAAHLKELLKRRHARMMASRPAVEPGVFKQRNNEFGSRIFVAPELVEETLTRGWPASRDLPSASARALYMLFFIAEVHPFNDGNGRISRLGMNADLEAAGQARLIVPTSYRSDYLGVLEALTARGDPEPYVSFGHKLIDLNSRMPFGSFEQSHDYFRSTGALDENSAALNLRPFIT